MFLELSKIGMPYVPGWEGLRPIAPELVIVATILAMLVIPFFTNRPKAGCLLASVLGVGLALLSAVVLGTGEGMLGSHFRGMIVVDAPAVVWKCLLLFFTLGVLVMWGSTTLRSMPQADVPEFLVLLLGATLGMSLMAQTSNLLMIVMAIELASFPSYVLAGFRKTRRRGAEAALKYVLFGASASAVMIYGLSLLYGIGGTLQFEVIAAALTRDGVGALGAVGLICLGVGIAFKISAVPVHLWCPDVFEGASIEVSAFLSVASKGAALLLMLRLITLLGDAAGFTGTTTTAAAVAIGVLGAITCTVGNTAAYRQENIKRLLAYSSIAQAGYMLCLMAVVMLSSAAAADATSALLIYLSAYLFMNLGAFTVAGAVEANGEGSTLADLSGLGQRAPVLAASMTASLFSLIGLPPLAGFAAKINLMRVVAEGGGWCWALVGVIGVNTVLSLYYYLRVIRVMYFEDAKGRGAVANPVASALALACAVLLLLMLVGFGVVQNVADSHSTIHR